MVAGARARWCVAAVAVVTAVSGVAAISVETAGAARAPTWKVGDCFEEADFDAASLDLTSKVACTKDHAAQIIGGAELPASLAKLSHDQMFSMTDAQRDAFSDVATVACGPKQLARTLYSKKTAKALAPLFGEHEVTSMIPPLAGSSAIVIPDATSFDAGAKDVLCLYATDPSFSDSTAGDARRVATDPLEALRICYVRNPGVGTDLATCGEDHDFEALIFLERYVGDRPVDPTQWSGTQWDPFDEMCADFAPVLVGATRRDLTYRANTQPDVAPVDGYRYIYCEAAAANEDQRLPAGTTVTGIGKKKIEFATA